MLSSMHEARTPRFERRIFQIQENFVRGNPKLQNPMFFVANTEERLPKDHPLRAIKRQADEVLKQMSRAFRGGVQRDRTSFDSARGALESDAAAGALRHFFRA